MAEVQRARQSQGAEARPERPECQAGAAGAELPPYQGEEVAVAVLQSLHLRQAAEEAAAARQSRHQVQVEEAAAVQETQPHLRLVAVAEQGCLGQPFQAPPQPKLPLPWQRGFRPPADAASVRLCPRSESCSH